GRPADYRLRVSFVVTRFIGSRGSAPIFIRSNRMNAVTTNGALQNRRTPMFVPRVAVLIFASIAQTDEDTKAIQAVEAAGGLVQYDLKQKGWPLVHVNFSETKIKDADLALLAPFKQLRSVNLDFTKLTDAALKELAGLGSLQSVSLQGVPVTGGGLKGLA